MNLLEQTEYKVTPLLKFKDRPLKGETSFIWTMTAFALAACSGGVGGNVVSDIPVEPAGNPDDANYAAEPSNFFLGTEMAEQISSDRFGGASYENSSASVKIDLNMPTDEAGYTSGHEGGFAEGDQTKDIHHLYGTKFKDILMGDGFPNWIYGAGDDDQLFGYGENDSLFGAGGNDFLDGGRGNDWVDYSASGRGVTVDLSAEKDSDGYVTASDGHAQGDRLKNIENIKGSKFSDTLTGDDGPNQIQGGKGYDELTGNGGRDLFIINPYVLGDGVPTIIDFTQGEDKIMLLLNEKDYNSFVFGEIEQRFIKPGDSKIFLEGKLINLFPGEGDIVFLDLFKGTLVADDFDILYSPTADIA